MEFAQWPKIAEMRVVQQHEIVRMYHSTSSGWRASSCPNEIYSLVGLFLGGAHVLGDRLRCVHSTGWQCVIHNNVHNAQPPLLLLLLLLYNRANDVRFVLIKCCCAFKCQLRRSAYMIFLTVWQNFLTWTDASQSSLLTRFCRHKNRESFANVNAIANTNRNQLCAVLF